MSLVLEIIFWACIIFISYAYVGYALLLLIVSLFRNCPVKKGTVQPNVSFIITAYNEELRIRDKLENSLAQEYPVDRLEIVVASDCSTDSTDTTVKTYANKGVRLIRAEERKGKEATQGLAVEATVGEILVFSDVAT